MTPNDPTPDADVVALARQMCDPGYEFEGRDYCTGCLTQARAALAAGAGQGRTVESINRALKIDLWQVSSFRADVRIDFREDGSVINVSLLNGQGQVSCRRPNGHPGSCDRQPEPRVVRTVEELEALPDWTVILEGGTGLARQKRGDGMWEGAYGEAIKPTWISLPATVLTAQPAPVSEEQVEAAAWAILERNGDTADRAPGPDAYDDAKEDALAGFRAAGIPVAGGE